MRGSLVDIGRNTLAAWRQMALGRLDRWGLATREQFSTDEPKQRAWSGAWSAFMWVVTPLFLSLALGDPHDLFASALFCLMLWPMPAIVTFMLFDLLATTGWGTVEEDGSGLANPWRGVEGLCPQAMDDIAKQLLEKEHLRWRDVWKATGCRGVRYPASFKGETGETRGWHGRGLSPSSEQMPTWLRQALDRARVEKTTQSLLQAIGGRGMMGVARPRL